MYMSTNQNALGSDRDSANEVSDRIVINLCVTNTRVGLQFIVMYYM